VTNTAPDDADCRSTRPRTFIQTCLLICRYSLSVIACFAAY